MGVKCTEYGINNEVRVVAREMCTHDKIVILLTWQNGRIKQKPKLGLPKLGRTTPARPRFMEARYWRYRKLGCARVENNEVRFLTSYNYKLNTNKEG